MPKIILSFLTPLVDARVRWFFHNGRYIAHVFCSKDFVFGIADVMSSLYFSRNLVVQLFKKGQNTKLLLK
jgi:hypothetical protein